MASVAVPMPGLPAAAAACPAVARLIPTPVHTPTPTGGGEDEFVPPANFALVCKGVYRSGFPKKRNFPYLRKLGIKSVLTLVLEDYPEPSLKFFQEAGIRFLQHGVPGNKEPFVDIPEGKIADALAAILDRRNHPMLIHCNKGKHRTGCLIGCLRKFQHWSHTSIFDEYRTFSHPKSRSMDQQFIELFDVRRVNYNPEFLPDWPEICVPGKRPRLALSRSLSALAMETAATTLASPVSAAATPTVPAPALAPAAPTAAEAEGARPAGTAEPSS